MSKKALISLSTIGLVSALVVGGTIAYFNDTETSTDNILVAGEMDLKVDHTLAFYNDLFCYEGDLVSQCDIGNLLKNGSFESPVVGGGAGWDIFPSGTPGFDWTVEWTDEVPLTYNSHDRPEPALTEYHFGVLGTPADGNQYAELDSDWDGPGGSINNEPASVKIYQYVPTIPGQEYEISFYYSPRQNTNIGDNHLEVYWGGNEIYDLQETPGSSLDWDQYTVTTTASGYSTKVEFRDAAVAPYVNSLGVLLDGVVVRAINCPEQQELVGFPCGTLFPETDIEDEKFFNFEDVKAGDYGRNVISFHVYDNDAWACLLIHDQDDQENELIDPEAEAGDETENEGELSKYLDVFAWRDDNNNGIYEPPSETAIAEGTLDSLESINLYDSLADEGVLVACEIKFVGLAWCAGELNVEADGEISCDGSSMLDDAQTDTFEASLTAYAEQIRNNPDFDCSEVEIE